MLKRVREATMGAQRVSLPFSSIPSMCVFIICNKAEPLYHFPGGAHREETNGGDIKGSPFGGKTFSICSIFVTGLKVEGERVQK
jgi:hypothetical protein